MSKIICGRGRFLMVTCYQNSHEIHPALVRAVSKLQSGWASPLAPRPIGILWSKLLNLQPPKAGACKLHTGNDPWHAVTFKSWPWAACETLKLALAKADCASNHSSNSSRVPECSILRARTCTSTVVSTWTHFHPLSPCKLNNLDLVRSLSFYSSHH